jgi:hypothetical protein
MAGDAQKDGWDRLTALSSIITPLVVVALGVYLPIVFSQAQQQAEENARDRELDAAEVGARATKAGVIPPLLDALLSTDPNRRKIAISALLIALPEEGPQLVREISLAEKNPSESVGDHATSALAARREDLVNDLFAPNAGTRQQAAQSLVQGYRDDPQVAQDIVKKAEAEPHNTDGVYNSTVLLGTLPTKTLAAERPKVERFLLTAEKQGPRTQQAAITVRQKLATR